MSKFIPYDCKLLETSRKYKIGFSTDKVSFVTILPKEYYSYKEAKPDIEKLIDLGIDLQNICLYKTETHIITFEKRED